MDKQEIGRLVEQFKDGNHDAFQVLYDLTRAQAYFVAIKITKSEEDALDILQDSYIKAWEKLDDLENPESFVSWFNQIVANAAKNYVCKSKPMLFSSEEDEAAVMEFQEETDTDFLPEKSLNKKESCRIVQSILDELPEDKKLCVILHHYEGMSSAQIAQALNISEGTVKSRLYYAHAKIRERVEALNKKGVTLFSGAALPFFVWLLGQYAETVRMTRKESAHLFRHIVTGSSLAAAGAAGATAGSAATAATTAATATAAETTAVTASAAAATAAAAGTGGTVAAAAAALTVPKVAAIVAAGVMAVSGAAIGTKKVIENRQQTEPTAIVTEATAAVAATEEQVTITSAPETGEESLAVTELTTLLQAVTTKEAERFASLNAVTRSVTATAAITTRAVSTTTPTTTVRATTTAKSTTTAAPTTTTEPATTAAPTTTAPATAKPTTTAAPKKANVNMVVYLDEESTTQFNFEVDPGTSLTTANLRSYFPAEYRDEMVSSPYAEVPVAAEDGSYQFYIIVE